MKKLALVLSILLFTSGCTAIDGNTLATDGAASGFSESPQTDLTETAEAAPAVITESVVAELTEPAVTEPAFEPKTVSFCAVGDNLIHSPIYRQAETGEGYDFSRAYKGVEDIIKNADLSVINQETLICNDMYPPSNYPMFNSPAALGNHMAEIGFDVFTLANNHCLDYGEQGLSYSLDYWESRNALTAGVYRNAEDKERIRTAEFGGITFSFLSYTESLNGLSLPQGSEMIIGDANDLEGMLADVRRAKEISQVCVVALHWGTENYDIVEDRQREQAKALAEAGADIIIGNHPHVLRSIEVIKREDGGETLCAYSLGNFISAQNIGANLIGGILEFNVTVAEENGTPQISDIKLTPIVTHYDSGYRNLRLYKLSDYTPELAAAHGVRQYDVFDYDFIWDYLRGHIDESCLAA